MNPKKNQNGITLMALIITIIVLLVLAGIVVNMISGNDDVIEKAQWTKYLTRFRQDEEKANLYVINQRFEASNTKIATLDISQINAIIDNGKKVYPITDERVQIENTSETLKQCIKYIEKIGEEEDITEEKVILYKADKEKIATNNNYVINIVSGKLYEIEAFKFQGKLYHRPEYGSIGANGPEVPEPPENPLDPEETELIIPYSPPSQYEEGLIINPGTISIPEGVEQNLSSLITIKLGTQSIGVNEVRWYQGEDIEDIDEYEEANPEEGEEEEDIEENDYEDDVITINNGKITGEVSGESTKICAIYKKDGKIYMAYLTVTVLGEEAEIDTTDWLPQVAVTVNRGKNKAIKVKNNAGKRISNKRFNWTVADEKIAKVNKRGIVNGVSGVKNGGLVKVTGTLKKDENIKVECQVTVLELTTFTPTAEIVKGNIKISTSIDKKYGMRYYTYIVDEQQIAKKLSKRYTVKKVLEKDAYHNIKVIASNGKYKVTSEVVSIYLPQLRFEVSVSNVNNNGWTQNKSITNGSESGYTIKYYYTTSPNLIGSSSVTSGTTSTSATGKSDLTTYYVWARATKTGESILSDNYIQVYTGHQHSGSTTSGGGCYGNATTCDGSLGYVFYINSNSYTNNNGSKTYTRYCDCCGSSTGNKTGYYTTSLATDYIYCKKCLAYVSHTHTTYKNWLCNSCYNSRRSYTLSDGTVISNGISSSKSYTTHCTQGTTQVTITHKTTYSRNCGKNETLSSFESIDF